MAAAVIKQMKFGYKVGGTGTDNTEVFSETKYIKAIYFSGNADNATCALSSKDLDNQYVTVHALKSNDTNELNSASGNMIWFGDKGSPFSGLQANLSHANDRVYIHVV